ncbi:MAG: hypothetical protein IPK19_34765 [Chloroflexi bacterium]|nr:hypothetical protein [Chloroflexota bacterium]
MSTQPPVLDDAVFQVDREHSGLRLAVLATFVVVWLIVFFVVSSLIASEGPSLLAVIVGFAVAYGATLLAERYLKGVWVSGRTVRIDRTGVEMLLKGQRQAQILSEDPARAVLWRFVIKKRARIPKGWSMFACALTAEDQNLCVYTFMPPNKVDPFARKATFPLLEPKKSRTLNDDDREDLRLAGEQKRLREAENMRWVTGAEMTQEDFIAFIDVLYQRYSEWMPTPK